MKKTLLLSPLAVLALLATTPANAQEHDPCEGRERYTIYYATHAIPHPFWSIVELGAEEGAKDHCLDLKWTQDVEFSVATTIERMEIAITEEPDMLVMTPTDPTAMRRTVERAREKGIPIIAINVPEEGDERLPYLIYVGGSEYQGGYEAAAQVIERGSPTRAACLNSFPGHVGLEARCKGWADRFAEDGIESEQVNVGGGPVDAEAALSAYIIANQDVDAFFTVSPGPENYEVALDVLRREGLAGEADLVTFDLTPIVLKAIKDGETLAAIDQQPYLQGYLPATLARHYLDVGLMPGRDVLTGPGVVNAENIDVVLAGTEAGRR